jgi:hypothetical protein
MSNLPNPDSDIKSAGARNLHQPQDPLPPPIRYSEALSDDVTQEGALGSGAASGQERPLGVQPARQGRLPSRLFKLLFTDYPNPQAASLLAAARSKICLWGKQTLARK